MVSPTVALTVVGFKVIAVASLAVVFDSSFRRFSDIVGTGIGNDCCAVSTRNTILCRREFFGRAIIQCGGNSKARTGCIGRAVVIDCTFSENGFDVGRLNNRHRTGDYIKRYIIRSYTIIAKCIILRKINSNIICTRCDSIFRESTRVLTLPRY